MKKKIIILLSVCAALTAMLCLTACGKWGTPYGDLDGQGFTVSVKFDANGGTFAGTSDVYVIDVFNPEDAVTGADGKKEIQLIPPDDEGRGYGTFEVSKNQCFLAGWYTDRQPRVDENGQPLDDYGVLTSVSGNPQGYVYSGRWDFENDRVKVDPTDTALSSSTPYLTLYAAWIPYFNFEIYSTDQNGSTELIGSVQTIELSVPSWNEKTGKIDMGNFPELEGKTFDGAFTSPDAGESISGKITGRVDYERGICVDGTVRIYSTWLDGEWYKIYTAEQFVKNSRLDANYIICADLDFSDVIWSTALTRGRFTGTIEGGGHTFSGINVTQADTKQLTNGFFGAIDAGAVIRDLTVTNATYTIEGGSIMTGANFGILAGQISADAVFENVSVSGTLQINAAASLDKEPQIGVISANGNGGIDFSGIECTVIGEGAENIAVTVDGTTGQISLSLSQ